VAGLAVQAQVRQAQADSEGARELVREAARVEVSPAVAGLLNPLPAVRARLALANGEVADAARWVRGHGLGVEDEPRYPHERDYLVLARVLLAEQAPWQALGLLARWHALAAAQGRTESVIELRALQALAHAADDDEPAALAALAEAVALAAPEAYLSVFLDEGAPMAALLRKLLTGERLQRLVADGAVPREYLTRLTAAFERAGAPVFPAARRGGVVVPGWSSR
jgi:LuxR family transcriptional regulator, maltose regulon positive regulatory protein